MKKISTAAAHRIEKIESQKLTIGLDLGDRWSWYCVLNEAGEVLLEQKLATTPKDRWQHRLKRERPTGTERTIAHQKSADGRMAAEAARSGKVRTGVLDTDRLSHGRRFHSQSVQVSSALSATD